ncbi:LuxR family transcriptional regulator [Actinoplanes sp. NPDC051633]|uniref:LuxR family transcriptional regulator n=1 Tax=Actinoplanes sp. NPDC051633 TaxID=3155670 RepID=UPI003425CA16
MTLAGRDDELAALGGATTGVVVEGAAGIGKSALLDAFGDQVRGEGRLVLPVRGYESESTLTYAGLLAVVRPLREHLDAVPAGHADALAAALGWRAGAGGDRFLVGAALLSLLAAAAERQPLLLAVDDFQWLDRESAEALLFAARRLDRDPVTVVITRRDDLPAPASLDGLLVIRPPGLTPAAAAEMLGPGFAPAVVDRLVAETGGNALALQEAGRGLTRPQRSGAAELPAVLPVPDRLQEVYARELTALSTEDRWAALLSACAREPHGWTFRHPLHRAATLLSATAAERRAAHAALAEALPPGPERTWHRAEAATGPDDQLAGELSRTAELDRTRRGYGSASTAAERAARLTADPAVRADRLAAAAGDAFMAGDGDRVDRLAREVLDAPSAGPAARSAALGALGRREQYRGSLRRSAELLARAAEVATGRPLLRTLTDLAHLRYMLGDPAGMADAARRAVAAADRDDPEQAMLAAYLSGAAQVVAGRPDLGVPLVREAVALLESDPALRDDPAQLVVALLAVRWLMDPAAGRAYVDRRLDRAREAGALGRLAFGLSIVAGGLAWLGEHRRAYAMAGEAVELLDALGYATEPGVAHETLAVECAGRGLHEEAAAMIRRAREVADLAGMAVTPPHLALSIATVALCRDDLDEVVRVLEEQIEVYGGVGRHLDPLGVAPMLVEAYLRLGRDADARALASRFAAAQPEQPDADTAARVHRCAALVAPEVDDDAFEAALRCHAAGVDQTETARTLLLHGMRLRRAGRRIDARARLREAARRFTAMDLTLWAGRAAEELAGTGERARSRTGDGGALTSQETRVALLVAEGRTNKEVATALFLSPKTVEHHVGAVLRKRGLRTRTELARDLSTPRG